MYARLTFTGVVHLERNGGSCLHSSDRNNSDVQGRIAVCRGFSDVDLIQGNKVALSD